LNCPGNCIDCGRCAGLPILDGFAETGLPAEPREGFGIAADLGTSGIVLALADLSDGSILARHSFPNPQKAFGADILSRIGAATRGQGAALRRLAAQSVCAGVETLAAKRGIRPESIRDMAVAGNTVMVHLLLGQDCGSLGIAPFAPGFVPRPAYTYAEVFGGGAVCPVRFVPWVSGFIGGDVTAGLLYLSRGGRRRFLLADLGTNAEMALYDNGRTVATAAAAGPAFETAAAGLGVSGVVRALAGLFRSGLVDETGRLAPGAPSVFSQREIRDLQLAKSAVRTGLELLLETAGMGYGELDAVYLAGGAGQAMNPDDAAAIGLLPAALLPKARGAGNTALGGAAAFLTAPKRAAADIEGLLAAAEGINLAAHPRFQAHFLRFIDFPPLP